MNADTMTIAVSLVAVIIAAIAVWRSGKPVTVEGVTTELSAAVPLAQELATVTQTAVQAAEQLYRTGKLPRDGRLDHAFAYARQWFPELDQAQIMTAIEAAVLVVNTAVAALPENAKNAKPAPTPHVPGSPGYPGSVPS